VICVLQRVSSAAVSVGERAVGSIERGLLGLVAVLPDDDETDVAYIGDRLSNLRIFADHEGRMNLSVEDVDGAILLVSQFTLAADTRRGRRPSFSAAASPEHGKRLFDGLVALIEAGPVGVQTGEFGAHMSVAMINDGPVTLILDSRKAPATPQEHSS